MGKFDLTYYVGAGQDYLRIKEVQMTIVQELDEALEELEDSQARCAFARINMRPFV